MNAPTTLRADTQINASCMISLLESIKQAEAAARWYDGRTAAAAERDQHALSQAAQEADERADKARKAARDLFATAFPGVDFGEFCRRVGL